jgi:hypothetical protein
MDGQKKKERKKERKKEKETFESCHLLINPERTKSIFWPIFEVWAGHCL